MLFLAIGLLAGVLAGLFGVGGGVVIVPALLFIAKLKPEHAIGTSLASLLLPVGALGAYRFYRDGLVELKGAMWIALGLFLGAWVGANLALRLQSRDLQRAFAVFLGYVAVQLWVSAR